MASGKDVVAFLLVLWLGGGLVGASERVKRELKFPKGTSFVTALALVSFLPKGLTDGLAHVLEFDLGFPFPDQTTIGGGDVKKKRRVHKIYKKIQRKSSIKDKERLNLLLRIEDAITRVGYNGPACVSRFCCELQHISPENSLLEKLLVSLFKTSSKFRDRDCQSFVIGCPISLLHVILHSEQIS